MKITTARDVSEVAEEPKVSSFKYMLKIGVIVILQPNGIVHYPLEVVGIKGVASENCHLFLFAIGCRLIGGRWSEFGPMHVARYPWIGGARSSP